MACCGGCANGCGCGYVSIGNQVSERQPEHSVQAGEKALQGRLQPEGDRLRDWNLPRICQPAFEPLGYGVEDPRNLVDEFKGRSVEDIREELDHRRRPFALLLLNIERDPNVGSLVRTANHFNAQEVFYYGRRKYNRQAALGTYLYTPVKFFAEVEPLVEATRDYTWVGIEQKPNAVPIQTYQWPTRPLIVLGHENVGLDISPEILYYCKELVSIPTLGSVRSLNVGVAGGIAIYDFLHKGGSF